MSETYEIDYESESILVDGSWIGREELARKIKKLLDMGDYRIARLSLALEKLEADLAEARLLAVRVAPGLARAMEEEASRRGCSSASLLRDVIIRFLDEASPKETHPSAPGPSRQNGFLEEMGSLDDKWFGG